MRRVHVRYQCRCRRIAMCSGVAVVDLVFQVLVVVLVVLGVVGVVHLWGLWREWYLCVA